MNPPQHFTLRLTFFAPAAAGAWRPHGRYVPPLRNGRRVHLPLRNRRRADRAAALRNLPVGEFLRTLGIISMRAASGRCFRMGEELALRAASLVGVIFL
jgi:hypothetical protein